MGILDGRHLLITGVISSSSLAFHVARIAQEEGAHVVLTSYGRRGLVEHVAARLPQSAPVLPLDVTAPHDLDNLVPRLREHTDGLDGLLHSIAYAPPRALGGHLMRARWEDAATALHVSAFSLSALTSAVLPLLTQRASVVGLDFDASVAWPDYNWMGVSKAALEACSRYLARDLGPRGIRVNLVASGPIRTLAASGHPGFSQLEAAFTQNAPLGWCSTDPEPVARTCAVLLSPWLPATTGEIVHADGGTHAQALGPPTATEAVDHSHESTRKHEAATQGSMFRSGCDGGSQPWEG